MPGRRPVLFVAALLLAAASAAADIDADVSNGNVVTATLSEPTTKATFRVKCPAGAALTVTATGVKKKGASTPAPTFVVKDPDAEEVGSDRLVLKGTTATAKAIPVAKSGVHSIVVSAISGTPGDVRVTATWKSPKAPPVSGLLTVGEETIEFAADAGAVATFDVSPSPKSTALPRLVRVDGPDFALVFVPPAETAKRHRVAGVALPATGLYTLRVGDGGAAGGAFRGKITVKPPAPVKTKLNLTDAAIGSATDHFAKVGTIGKGGGTVVVDELAKSPIDGAAVTVGSGTLKAPVTIVVASGVPINAQDEDQTGAGPTVFFGPDGLKFGEVVTLTLPFDPATFDGDFAKLKVFTKDAKGNITLVTAPVTVDLDAGTVSFQTSHFSSYRVFGPAGSVRGDLNADGFADLVLPAPGDSSNRGAVFVHFGRADFLANPPAAPSASFVGTAGAGSFGSSVATGDVNGDGIDDLLVGAPAVSGSGAVYVFFGGGLFASATAASADATLTGASTDREFGALVVVADVTGDGIADAVVASPSTSAVDFASGVIYVFRGATTFSSLRSDAASVIALKGVTESGYLGNGLAAGDVTGDGTADVAAGELRIGLETSGAVVVFPGGPLLATQFAGTSSIGFVGADGFDHFGEAIAIGDFNQDGDGDLAVGAPYEDGVAGVFDVGRVYVFFGGTGLTGRGATAADVTIARGTASTDFFGASLAAGNVIGSASIDLLIATPGHDEAVGNEGRIDLAMGGGDFVSVYERYSEFAPNDFYGTLLTPVDLDGDGRDEAIFGSPDRGLSAGRVIVRFGPGLLRDRQVIFNGTPGQRLGGGRPRS
jgi:hypothetical protein